MGRMCAKSDHLPDPWEPWPDGDAFFCWVAVGDVRKILAHLPGNPAHVGWFRQGRGWGRNHWMPAERFKSAIAFADANC